MTSTPRAGALRDFPSSIYPPPPKEHPSLHFSQTRSQTLSKISTQCNIMNIVRHLLKCAKMTINTYHAIWTESLQDTKQAIEIALELISRKTLRSCYQTYTNFFYHFITETKFIQRINNRIHVTQGISIPILTSFLIKAYRKNRWTFSMTVTHLLKVRLDQTQIGNPMIFACRSLLNWIVRGMKNISLPGR